jgi:glycerol-3-phosphate dehydrogenase (NAD(P)+)
MARVGVIGAGAWGTAIAIHAARRGHTVRLWAREPEVLESVRTTRINEPFLPGFPLPATISVTADRREAAEGAELLVLVPPSKFLREVAGSLVGAIEKNAVVGVASKGIEESSLSLMGTVMGEVLPEVGPERLAFLSGPTFAKEVAQGLPCDIVAASKDMVASKAVQELLHTPFFRVYGSADPIGVEVGGALKNVLAIAAGATEALNLGFNARAAIITRGLAEMTRFGVAMGADPLTFLGLAGIGDLVLTCTGPLSRNRALGEAVGKGQSPAEYVASHRTVAEGYWTAKAAYDLAQKLGIDAPIGEQVYYVLHRGRPLMEALGLLMNREFKDELRGIRIS